MLTAIQEQLLKTIQQEAAILERACGLRDMYNSQKLAIRIRKQAAAVLMIDQDRKENPPGPAPAVMAPRRFVPNEH